MKKTHNTMPKPRPNETKNDYISRCIEQVVGEGKPERQAIAICESMWTNRNKMSAYEKALKDLKKDESS